MTAGQIFATGSERALELHPSCAPVRLSGTWFEFRHHNPSEGAYWNPACYAFTEEQWREKIREIAGLKMRFLVLMCTSLVRGDLSESYFPDGPYPQGSLTCREPVNVLLSECDRLGLRVFLGCGFYGEWTHSRENMTDPDVRSRTYDAMDRLHARFHTHPSFYGWYLPDEIGLSGDRIPDFFLDYVNGCHAHARSLDPFRPMLIAPYGIARILPNDRYTRDLSLLNCEYIAYQDGVGVGSTALRDLEACFDALKKAHDRAGHPALWADIELFSFEGTPYSSPLIPANASRVQSQLQAVAPYADEVLAYQYQGMMNPRGSTAFCGHPDSVHLYENYRRMAGLM